MFEALSTSSLSTSINYGRKKKPEKPLNAQMKNCKIERKNNKNQIKYETNPLSKHKKEREKGVMRKAKPRITGKPYERKHLFFFFNLLLDFPGSEASYLGLL